MALGVVVFGARASLYSQQHLLHWFEGLSVCGELESRFKSLYRANESLSVSAQDGEIILPNYLTEYANAHAEYQSLAMLFEDARRCLQSGFDAIIVFFI